MEAKGAKDLPGLTAQEIWDAYFRNELDEEDRTETIARTSGFLVERGFDVWEHRDTVTGGTTWRDGLDKVWLVNPDNERIEEREE